MNTGSQFGDNVVLSGANPVLGNVSLTNADNAFVTAPVGGNLTINDIAKGGAVLISADVFSNIGGNLSFTGGFGLGSGRSLASANIGGSVYANLGTGAADLLQRCGVHGGGQPGEHQSPGAAIRTLR